MHRTRPRPTPDALRLAAAALADPRTAESWLRGVTVRGAVGDRLAAAAAQLGLQPTITDRAA